MNNLIEEEIKRKRKKTKRLGWLLLLLVLILIWLGGCGDVRGENSPREGKTWEEWRREQNSKITRTNETDDLFIYTSEFNIEEFSYKGHHYLGFPFKTYQKVILSVVHDPDCEKCLTNNNKQ